MSDNQTIEKSVLWLPISKSTNGKYSGILSDTSIDRDGERISKKLISKWASNPNRYLPALVDHTNKVENLVGKWQNPRILKSNDGNHIATMEIILR